MHQQKPLQLLLALATGVLLGTCLAPHGPALTSLSPWRAGLSATGGGGGAGGRAPDFYPGPDTDLRRLARTFPYVTDKVVSHKYDAIYAKYLSPVRRARLKMLEIGLGCNMEYGPGASARVWRAYLPNAELWFAEVDSDCAAKKANEMKALRINVVTGDQGDNATLDRWIGQFGGGFDVIIDDGGHKGHQIFNAFAKLFPLLKPGGIYFLEDLQVSRWSAFNDGAQVIFIDVLKDWIESLLGTPVFASPDQLANKTARDERRRFHENTQMEVSNGPKAYHPTYKLPPGVKFIDCMSEMCAVLKCKAEDTGCPDGYKMPE